MSHYLCAFIQDHWQVYTVPISLSFTPMACRLPSGALVVALLIAGGDSPRAALLTAIRELRQWMPATYASIAAIAEKGQHA